MRISLEETLKKTGGILVIDGSMATALEGLGCDLNNSLWTAKALERQPELVKQVHLDYFRAGADCGITCSYQATIPGLKKNGCSDPAWPDGVNLNLVRNHIIYWYRLLRERTSQTVQLSMFDAGMDLRNERPLPPEVPDKYMVPTGKYPDRLNGKWDGLIFDPTI